MAERNQKTLGERYFNWLYDQVNNVRDIDSPHSYTVLCDHMHRKPFNANVPYDDNRAAEGSNLRKEFLNTYRGHVGELDRVDLLYPDATIFEVLIGLTDRINFMIDMPKNECFRMFISNLKLNGYTDEAFIFSDTYKIDRVLDKFNYRRYDRRGRGGLFPLKHAGQDQTKIELWYQLAAYLTENAMY